MSKIETEYLYRPPTSPLPLMLGGLMVVLAPMMVTSLSQPASSDLEMRVKGLGHITLTPAQQPIAGWVFGVVLLLVGILFILAARRQSSKLGRIAFTEQAFIFSAPTSGDGEAVVPYGQIVELSASQRGRGAALRFTCPLGSLTFPASRMESPQAYADICSLLEARVNKTHVPAGHTLER